jgi:esterase
LILSIHFHIANQDSDLPAVVLIHGLFGSHDNLAALRRSLQDSYKVISIDLPDHGKSAHTSQFSFEKYTKSIAQALSTIGVTRAHFVAHSLGGKVAMYLALHHQEMVDKLVVVDIAPAQYQPRHQNVLKGLRAIDLNTTKDRKHADQQLSEHVAEPGVRQFLLKSLEQHHAGWKWRFNLDILERDYFHLSAAIDSVSAFTRPVLFVKGANSDYLTAQHRKHINKLFPNSEAKIIHGTGHWLHAEKPAIFSRLVSAFLSDNTEAKN